MKIANIRLRGFKCYREESDIPLEGKVYAVTARNTRDPDRSNWQGKSTFLESILFALYGHHTADTEDDWISRGEKSGEVELAFDDGSRVVRSRTVGKSTRLFFFSKENPTGAIQDEAQKLIVERIGLAKPDFMATCFFGQKQMSQLVTIDAGNRMKIVSAWLRLEPLQRCEEEARLAASKLSDQFQQYVAARRAQTESLAQTLAGETKEALEAKLEAAGTKLATARGDVALAASKLEEMANRFVLEEKAAQYAEVCRQGKAAKEVVEAFGPDEDRTKAATVARDRAEEIGKRRTLAEREARARLTVARGEFDGACPVASITCPVKAQINAGRAAAMKEYEVANGVFASVSAEYDAAQKALREAVASHQEHVRASTHLDQLREQAKRLKAPAVEHAKLGVLPDREEARRALSSAQEAAQVAAAEQAQLATRIRSAAASTEAIVKVDAASAEIEKKLATAREALVVFGKTGAQRRVAEAALGQIEEGANELLRESGIDLELGLRWSREGSGLATACEACGSPFPSSAKVKTCPRCGTERGANLINKLEVALSARSGAAEDLAGGALQLSASKWLRADRASAWSVALIDEPFGALDKANRMAFAGHLTTMLRRHFEQAFVIAHTPDTVYALPGRIEIVSDGRNARVEVVS